MKLITRILSWGTLALLSACSKENFYARLDLNAQPGPAIVISKQVPPIVKGGSVHDTAFTVTPNRGRHLLSLTLQYSADGDTFSDLATLAIDAQSYDFTVPSVDFPNAKLKLLAQDDLLIKSEALFDPFEIRTRPPLFTLDPGQDGQQTKANSQTFSGACEHDFEISVSVSLGGGVPTVLAPIHCVDKVWTFSQTVSADGPRRYTFKETDPVGLSTELVANWTRDTVAPTLTVNGLATLYYKQATHTFTGTCETTLPVKITYVLNGGASQSSPEVLCAAGSWTYVASPGVDGTAVYTFTQTDPALNVTSRSATRIRDMVAPALTVSGPASSYYNQTTLTLSGTCENTLPIKVAFTLNGGASQSSPDESCVAGAWTYVANPGVDGPAVYTFSQTDLALNVTSRSATRIRDMVAPALTVSGPATLLYNQPTHTFSGTCENTLPIKAELVLNGGASQVLSTNTTCAMGAWTYVANPGADGTGVFTFSQTDLALNLTSRSSTRTRDTMAPHITLYLGTIVPVANACTTVPQQQNPIALRQVPFDFCATDESGGSGLTHFCLKHLEDGVPSATDPCWVPIGSVDKRAVLNDDLNTMRAYVRDLAGNVGMDTKPITLNVGRPPEVSIIHPTGGELVKSYWQAGDRKSLVFSAVDDDTPVAELRYQITLMRANDPTKYWHLGCNFSDVAGSSYRICTDPAQQNQVGFSGPNSQGQMQFDFTVPTGWDATQKYLALITAIDKSGNAAVVSTQEINAPWEVLAGRTYAGLGGSGVTIQVKTRGETSLAANSKGEIIQTNGPYKLNAFDHRSCRFLRKPNTTTPFDCVDAIESTLSPSGNGWVYNPTKDVFYAPGSDRISIYEIDFNKQPKATLTPVFGGAGKIAISRSLPTGALATNYSGTIGVLFYSVPMKRLFFRIADAIYSIDENGLLRFVIGGSQVDFPADQSNVAQSSLVLPSGNFIFALSEDGRMILNGIAGFQTNTYYLVSGINQNNPSAPVSLSKLYVTNQLSQIDMDEKGKRFLLTVVGAAVYTIALPPLGSPLTAYTYARLLASMRQFAYTGGDLLYVVDAYTGAMKSFNLTKPASTTNPETDVGFNIGSEPDQYGQNRRLFYPRSVFIDPQGKLVFNDLYNVQRITLETSTSPSLVTTLIKGVPPASLKYEPGTNSLLSTARNALLVRDYSNLSAAATTIGPVTGTAGYENGYGFANLSRKVAFFTGAFDYVSFTVKYMFAQVFNFVDRSRLLMSNPDTLNYNVPFCNGTMPCGQGPEQVVNGVKSINFADLRIQSGGTGLSAGAPVSTYAFDATDENLYVCITNRFMKLNFASAKAYPYTVKDANGKVLTCGDFLAVFHFHEGVLYWAQGDAFYSMDTSKIEVDNTAVFTQENAGVTPTSLYGARTYGGMFLDPQFIYFTEQNYQRVIRLPRITH